MARRSPSLHWSALNYADGGGGTLERGRKVAERKAAKMVSRVSKPGLLR